MILLKNNFGVLILFFQIIGIIFGVIWVVFFISLPARNTENFKNEYECFIAFLEKENDLETLYRIGEYNKNGEKEPWGARSYTYYSYLWEKTLKIFGLLLDFWAYSS